MLAHAITEDITDILVKFTALAASLTALVIAITGFVKLTGVGHKADAAQQQANEAGTKATEAKAQAEGLQKMHEDNARNIVSLNEQTTRLGEAKPVPAPATETTLKKVEAAVEDSSQKMPPNP